MDSNQARQQKLDTAQPADERSSATGLLFGGVVLMLGGLILIVEAHGVADITGGMLAFIGFALAAASIWIYTSKPGDA